MKKIISLIVLFLFLGTEVGFSDTVVYPIDGAGSGDVTAAANIADNAIVRGDGGAKGVQESTATIDDSGNLIFEGKQIINVTDLEALLVEDDGGVDIFIVDTLNKRVGILGTPTRALDVWEQTFLFGSSGVGVRANNADKFAFYIMPHYDNTEQEVLVFRGFSDSTNTILEFGGGTGAFNAATKIRFYTAIDTTTVAGTQALYISPDGNIGIPGEVFGTNAVRVLGIGNGTAPTISPADMIQMWADDYGTGDSRLYVMGEASTNKVIIGNGTVIAETSISTPSVIVDPSALPGWVFEDLNNPGADKEIAKIYADYLDGADGSENGGMYLQAMLSGGEVTWWQFEANTALISSVYPVSTTGTISGGIVVTAVSSMPHTVTTRQIKGGWLVVTAVGDVDLPSSPSVGDHLCVEQGDASEVVSVAVGNASHDILLSGTLLGVNNEIDSPGGAGDRGAYICMVYAETNLWRVKGREGTWVDGGGVD